jgi:hypothetical protein
MRTRLEVAMEIDSLSLIKRIAATGQLHTILPRSCIASGGEDGPFAITVIRKPVPFRQLFLTMQPQAEFPRAIL